MRTAKILVIEEAELRDALRDFAIPMAQDTVADVISEGEDAMPYIIEVAKAGGFANMSFQNLIEFSEPWADFVLDSKADEGNPDDNAEGIVVIDKNGSQHILYCVRTEKEVEGDRKAVEAKRAKEEGAV